MRLDKPIGFMLLFWPCSWGFAYSIQDNLLDNKWIYYLILFFIGSILMRSAGCVYNDIVDKKLDAKVKRTKNRPLVKKTISIQKAWLLILTLCLTSLIILFQFNINSIYLGLSSGLLILLYPFMKRITYWPQLFLGIVFNWGVILSYCVLNNKIDQEIFILFCSAIFWTLGYDTIYGLQDIYDDLKIGVKSTAIKFKKNIKTFLSIVYFVSFSLLIFAINLKIKEINLLYFLLLIPLIFLIYQIINIDIKKTKKNFFLFKLNNYYGLSTFVILTIIFKNA